MSRHADLQESELTTYQVCRVIQDKMGRVRRDRAGRVQLADCEPVRFVVVEDELPAFVRQLGWDDAIVWAVDPGDDVWECVDGEVAWLEDPGAWHYL